MRIKFIMPLIKSSKKYLYTKTNIMKKFFNKFIAGIKSLDTYVKVFLIVFGILLVLGLLKTFDIFSITL